MFRLLSKHRQLFVNDNNVELGRSDHRYGSHNLRRVLHQPRKQGLVVVADQPWESPVIELLSNNVVFDEEKRLFRLWYNCFIRQWYDACNMEVESSFVLYAESVDGVNWVKPKLGQYDVNGSKENNICVVGPGCGVGWSGVVDDRQETAPQRRLKMLSHGTVGPDHGIVIYFSPDGTNWTPYPYNPVLYARVDCGDSHSIMGCRDPRSGRFVATVRPQDWYLSYPDVPTYRYDRAAGPQGDVLEATHSHRRIGLSFSDDFTLWTPARQILQADLDDPPGTQMQGMTLCPYEGLYLGFVMMHYADGANDTIDVQLAVSNDLLSWQRVGNRKPFVPIGDEGLWHSNMIFAVSSTPILVGDELYFYYNAHKTTHYAKHEDRRAAIGLAKLRRDGFVSMHAEGEGFLVTKPFTFDGSQLHLNADAAGGSVKVQILDERQRPLENYLSAACDENSVDQLVRWPEGQSLGSLAGRAIRLKFIMTNAHLYSFWIN